MTKYIVYGKENCQFCDKAKALLDLKGLEYSYYRIGVSEDEVSKEELVELCSYFEVLPRSVPQIFTSPHFGAGYEKWTYVGGYTELESKLK